LIINEFQYNHFNCGGGATSQCITTGREVISQLSFDKQSLRQSVLGLGCCLLIFLFAAIIFLENNKLSFLKLGHVGAKNRRYASSTSTSSFASSTASVAQPDAIAPSAEEATAQ
jgi:hypothetical protein